MTFNDLIREAARKRGMQPKNLERAIVAATREQPELGRKAATQELPDAAVPYVRVMLEHMCAKILDPVMTKLQ